MAIAAAAAVLVGFAPTFYLRGYFELRADQPPLSPLLLVHGLIGTLWIALFVTQSFLVLRQRTDIHRRLGIAGAVVASLLVIVGVITAIDALRRNVEPYGLDARIWFLAVPLTGTLMFGALVAAALFRRRRPETHKRLMLLATVILLNPAFGRLVGRYLPVGLTGFLVLIFALTDLFVIIAVTYDFRTRRQVHPVFIWGGLVVLLLQPLMLVIGGTNTALAFAALFR
jgi:uncharacterized protein (TIGR03382 family)